MSSILNYDAEVVSPVAKNLLV